MVALNPTAALNTESANGHDLRHASERVETAGERPTKYAAGWNEGR
jgi:hypothetical protein